MIFQSLTFNKFLKTKLAIIKIIKVREKEREREEELMEALESISQGKSLSQRLPCRAKEGRKRWLAICVNPVSPCPPQKGQQSLHSFPDEIKEDEPFHPRFSSFEEHAFFPSFCYQLQRTRSGSMLEGPARSRVRCSISEIISFPGRLRPPFRPSNHGIA